jgi:hypothetical protein
VPVRQNKFARQAARQRISNLARDEQMTIDQQLARLEEDIRRLKIEFDIYFNGSSKRPPYDTKSRVESVIKRVADERSLTYVQRYFYNSLVARYTSFRELWRRTMQGREEGRDAISAGRNSHRVGDDQPPLERVMYVCDDAHRDITTVRRIYESLLEAKRHCGEPTGDLSFPQFHHLIASKTDKLKDTLGCQRVRYSVGVENGRVNFKARADDE